MEEYETQVRGRVPRFPPLGAVIERDGPVVRTHYGTHGSVDHGDLGDADLADLVRRQLEAFAARCEPVEWRVHDTDTGLAECLAEAGFTAGWERPVLVMDLDQVRDVRAPGHRIRLLGAAETRSVERVRRLAARTGPHRRPFPEMEADGGLTAVGTRIHVVESDARILDAAWAERVGDTGFLAIGGMTGFHPEFLGEWARWAVYRPHWAPAYRPVDLDLRHLLAEAAGEMRDVLTGAGFREIATVRSYHWTPPCAPARERAVRQLISEPEHDDLWDRCYEQFRFQPSIDTCPGVTEPPRRSPGTSAPATPSPASWTASSGAACSPASARTSPSTSSTGTTRATASTPIAWAAPAGPSGRARRTRTATTTCT